ncbi:MAG TPA: glycosyl hydrolase family 8, partial [Polyangiaceae bacterium]
DTHRTLNHLTPPPSYPNAFGTLLGKTDAEISDRILAAYAQLFHGDPSTQAVYFEQDATTATIEDIYHQNDVRTEGLGWGMLISVELDKRDEFDRLWRYSKATARYASGPYEGYFQSWCDMTSSTVSCADPFGLEQFVMSLVLANDRWGGAIADIDYEADAIELFDLMLDKEQQSGGAGGVTNTFDSTNKLTYDVPNVSASSYTRPALEMPGYYRLWAEATGNPFWLDAAAAADAPGGYWDVSANATTGLWPVRAYFDGAPVTGSDTFVAEAYRTELNLAVDQIWSAGSSFNGTEATRLLGFFSSQGIDTYGTSYQLDGTNIVPARETALILANGTLALISSNADREGYVSAVWDQAIPSGDVRYYAGMLDLLALMILGGQFRVY